MRTIGLYNIKGGVGKSTAAVNLACLASLEGRRTLLWDLDPQGAASYYLQGGERPFRGGKRLLRGELDAADLIRPTDLPNLDLLPSGLTNRNLDLHLRGSDHPRKTLSNLVRALADTYAIVVFDSPPGITLLSENLFRAADFLLVPLIPTPLSIRAYEEIVVFFERHRLDRSRLLPFFSMAQSRTRMHRETMELFAVREPSILRSAIPHLSAIERMSATRRSIAVARGESPAAMAYRALWEEIKARVLEP